MPDIVHLLPDSVANQIAAGEVIQRPASAVKELLENALDSGATQVDLIVKDAGKALIQVTDNGCGMSETDARLAFERHATSKISKVDDLFQIRTMGFRGEALASIAAIAQVEIKTRLSDQDIGTCIVIEGSEVKSQDFCECAQGTTIMVKNLFYNVPARRKFLKSFTVELRHIIEEFQRVALANPGIDFNMFNDRKPVFQLKASNLKRRIVAVFGTNFNSRLLPVEQKMDLLSITGFVGKPEFAKKTRGEQYFYVNNRYIKHPYLNHALISAFEELIPDKAYPSYFLMFDIDPGEIDINIHPTKTEIKFQDEKLVYSILRSAIKAALGKFSVTPSIDFNVETTFDFKPIPKGQYVKQPQIRMNPDYNPFENNGKVASQREEDNRQHWDRLYSDEQVSHGDKIRSTGIEPGPFSQQIEAEFLENVLVPENLFQLHRRYILSQVKSGLMVIDQQKAHERILFERYFELLGKRHSHSQQELFPVKLSLSPADAELLNEIVEELKLVGFSIKPDSTRKFIYHITGTPADLKAVNIGELIERILDSYKSNLMDFNVDKNLNLARSMARNLSIKPGKMLHIDEMKAIIEELFACKVPEYGVDGESIITIITLQELDIRFAGKQ